MKKKIMILGVIVVLVVGSFIVNELLTTEEQKIAFNVTDITAKEMEVDKLDEVVECVEELEAKEKDTTETTTETESIISKETNAEKQEINQEPKVDKKQEIKVDKKQEVIDTKIDTNTSSNSIADDSKVEFKEKKEEIVEQPKVVVEEKENIKEEQPVIKEPVKEEVVVEEVDKEYERLMSQVEYKTREECMNAGFAIALTDTVNILGFDPVEIIYKGKVIGYKLRINYTNPMEQ